MTNSASAQIAEVWRHHRPYLVNLAYQMLGDVGDAEDVAQEAFLRLSRTDVSTIDDVRAWLTVVAGRLCLDQVRSARARYERPDDIGSEAVTLDQPGRLSPADRVTLDDEVRTALLEVLRRLSPGERVVVRLARRVRGALRRDRGDRRPPGRHLPAARPAGADENRSCATEAG